MTSLRGTKRRLDLDSESPEPAETLTTDGSFLTAESNFGEDQHDDMTEISSPARPGKIKKWSKEVEQLNEDAASFAKARTLLRRAGPTRAGLSQREQRAQLRAQRLEQKTARAHHAEEGDDILHDADAIELEAAASLVDFRAHEAVHATGNDDGSQAMSQDTGSSADRAFAAAWARVHGNDASDAAAPSRFATAWQAQHESSGGPAQVHSPPATRRSPGHQAAIPAQANITEQDITTVQQSVNVQPSLAAAQFPLRADTVASPVQHAHLAEAEAMHAPEEDQMYGADNDHGQEQLQPPAGASPLAAARPQQPSPSLVSSMPRAIQQGLPAVHSPATGEKARSPAASKGIGCPTTAVPVALGGNTPASGTGTHVAGLAAAAAAAASVEQAKAARHSPELEARAMQIAMQRLVAREAEEKKQDEALVQACPSSSLVHIPLWGSSSLSPETVAQLQGNLAVPATCSVRLFRRIFARAVQVQPACVQLVMPQTGVALQDFTAGQEASIKQYGLDGAAGRQGLHVQLQLQEGCARVEALIQQEVHLVKQELLSARLRSPAPMKPTGTSPSLARSPAGPSVTAVLRSAGWGTTSPAKRIPKALPANEGGHQLADYEAMLPAEQSHTPGAPVVSPGRRKVGRWSQEEVAMLITKMEAGHFWAQIRNEWPKLGFPKRSDVDLKDKWRNLEDAVLRGRPTRTVKLTQDQMERIHRCHRKYRAMQASASPSRSRSPRREQAGPSDRDSVPKKQADKSGDSYNPTELTSSDDGGNAGNQNTSPMVTRSRAQHT